MLTPYSTVTSAAHQIGVSAGTLREYERVGLISPARDSAGRRIFTAADVERARAIAKTRSEARGSGLRNHSKNHQEAA